jgi:hypothetical protein
LCDSGTKFNFGVCFSERRDGEVTNGGMFAVDFDFAVNFYLLSFHTYMPAFRGLLRAVVVKGRRENVADQRTLFETFRAHL